jgi:hypothetical protein
MVFLAFISNPGYGIFRFQIPLGYSQQGKYTNDASHVGCDFAQSRFPG